MAVKGENKKRRLIARASHENVVGFERWIGPLIRHWMPDVPPSGKIDRGATAANASVLGG